MCVKSYDLLKFNLESGGYENISNVENRKLFDYYVNGEKQSEESINYFWKEVERRANHNIWIVVSSRGTKETIDFCKQIESELKDSGRTAIFDFQLVLKGQKYDYRKECLDNFESHDELKF